MGLLAGSGGWAGWNSRAAQGARAVWARLGSKAGLCGKAVRVDKVVRVVKVVKLVRVVKVVGLVREVRWFGWFGRLRWFGW